MKTYKDLLERKKREEREETAADIVDAEYNNLKKMTKDEVMNYLIDMGFPKKEAQNAVRTAGFSAKKKTEKKSKDVIAVRPKLK